jgi:hypothetical protein
MLWLGYIYYVVFLILFTTLLTFFFKITYYTKFLKSLTSTLGTPVILGPLLFFTFLAMSTLYSLLDYNYQFNTLATSSNHSLFDYSNFNFMFGSVYTNFFFHRYLYFSLRLHFYPSNRAFYSFLLSL